MDFLENTDKEKKLTIIQLTITIILIVFFSVTGATYAYFAINATDTETIMGEAATVNLTLDVEKIFPTASSTNTGVIVPQLSTSGSNNSPLAAALRNGCVDGNSNIVCQVYKINIQNIGGTATQMVDGRVDFYGNEDMTADVSSTMPNLKWKLITSVNTATPTNSVLGDSADIQADATGNDNIFADDVILVANSNIDPYYMIVWINETQSDQAVDEGNSFYAKISFESSNGTGVSSTFTS